MIKKLGKAALVLALGFLSACNGDSSTPTEPRTESLTSSDTTPLHQTFELRPGETARLDSQVEVKLVRVFDDSRCPIEAFCVRAGTVDAEIEVRQPSGATSLHLHYDGQIENQQPRSAGSYAFTMDRILPSVSANRVIQPQEYKVTFTATRR